MNPAQEKKFDAMHEAVIRMDERQESHIKNHPTQPCERIQKVEKNVEDIRGNYIKALGAALLSVAGFLWLILSGGGK